MIFAHIPIARWSKGPLPSCCDTGYCDKALIVTVFSSNIMSTTLKLSDIVTIGYCETFRWSQHCHNKREALYLSLGRGRSHCWKLTTIKKGRRGQCPIDLQRICACRCQISQHFPTKLPSLTDSPSLKPKAGICYARFV